MTLVNDTVAKLTRRVMDANHLTPRSLAKTIGCSVKSVYNLLDAQETRLTQEQYFNLFTLAGVIRCTK